MNLNALWGKKYWLLAGILTVFIITLLFGKENDSSFATAKVTVGDLLVSVNATGTIEPEELIDVGSQVAGRILQFGTDINGRILDYGSQVAKDSLLAVIDDSVYAADVASANAQLQRAQADLLQIKAKLELANNNWKRAELLGPSDALSTISYQTYKSEYEVAKANVTIAEAAIVQAQAELEKAQRNLSFCTIRSPVDGVIIDKKVNIGQTVVSNLSATSLFLLAKDLKKMQVWVAVNEADIGSIHPGQRATFTVDTFPDRVFEGVVNKIRLNASMTSNVVTYIVEVNTDNSDETLFPYLTANVLFEVTDHKNVKLVPNQALRFVPDQAGIKPSERENFLKNKKPAVWIREGEYLKPAYVETVATDNIYTEIKSESLQDGQEVVTGISLNNEQADSSTNPFMPQMRRRR